MSDIIRDAIPDDWLYIDSLRKTEWSALGFIPQDCYLSILHRLPIGGRRRWTYSKILVAEDNGDLTGFAYASFTNNTARIFQVAVQEDARRLYRASLMVGEIELEALYRQCHSINVRVAIDLEANEFWKALGYELVDVLTSTWRGRNSAKGRLLGVYVKHFAPLLARVAVEGI